jgi:plastocyanin
VGGLRRGVPGHPVPRGPPRRAAGGDPARAEVPAEPPPDRPAGKLGPVGVPVTEWAPGPRGIEVRVTSRGDRAGRITPAVVWARRGDTLHFATDGSSLHKLYFVKPADPYVIVPPPSGYLALDYDRWDFVIRSPVGTYQIRCETHEGSDEGVTLVVEE